MSKYPFLDRIPANKRLTAINALEGWQNKNHRCKLDCVKDFKAGRYNPLFEPEIEIRINAPSWEEDNIDEINREMSRPPESQERIN